MKKDVAEYLDFAFEKLDRLKQSDRGEVWRARNRQSGEPVIIKHVRLTSLPYDALKKFRFTLPAKVFLCAVDEDEADTVIVEEFIGGENLIERLERKDFLSESEARKILLQMCDGLKELHAQKIIHRDIKPSNLILQGDRIRLIDFDAARIFKPDKNSDTQLFGTKGYAPPEQYGGRQTDERSDIYSLGVTMKILLGDNLRGRLKTILDRCTEFDPKNRFQSVDELKAALTAESPRRKNFFATTIFTAAIILFASAQHLNRDENFSEPGIERVEEIPPAVEAKLPDEKFPAQVDGFKFPEIVTPTQTEFSTPKLPESQAVTPRSNFQLPPVVEQPSPVEKNYSGLVKTEFYLNDSPFDQSAQVGNMKISRDEWRQTQARLHIVNDSGRVWLNPTVNFVLGQNWGDNFTDTKILPTLGVDEAADVVIPFNLLTVSDRPNTSAYIQVRLIGDGAEADETYWSTWFDVTD